MYLNTMICLVATFQRQKCLQQIWLGSKQADHAITQKVRFSFGMVDFIQTAIKIKVQYQTWLWRLSKVSFVVIVQLLSQVRLFCELWTVARQAPLSMGFLRQEYQSELLFPSPGDLSDPGNGPKTPASPEIQANSVPLSRLESPTFQTISKVTET